MAELLFDSTPSADIRTKPGLTQEAVWPSYVKFLEDLSQHPGEPVLVYRMTEESYAHERGSHAEKQITMGIIREDVQPVAPDAEKLFIPVHFADKCIADWRGDHKIGEPSGSMVLYTRCMVDSWNVRDEIYEDADGSKTKLIEEPCYQHVVGLENIANWANERGDQLRRTFFEMSLKLGLDPSLTPELKQMMLKRKAELVQRLIQGAAEHRGQIKEIISGKEESDKFTSINSVKTELKEQISKLGITEAELGKIVLKAHGIDVELVP